MGSDKVTIGELLEAVGPLKGEKLVDWIDTVERRVRGLSIAGAAARKEHGGDI